MFLFVAGFSPDQKFPGAEYAPYKSVNYEWNPIVWYVTTYNQSFLKL
jgi:hypothetical protein